MKTAEKVNAEKRNGTWMRNRVTGSVKARWDLIKVITPLFQLSKTAYSWQPPPIPCPFPLLSSLLLISAFDFSYSLHVPHLRNVHLLPFWNYFLVFLFALFLFYSSVVFWYYFKVTKRQIFNNILGVTRVNTAHTNTLIHSKGHHLISFVCKKLNLFFPSSNHSFVTALVCTCVHLCVC